MSVPSSRVSPIAGEGDKVEDLAGPAALVVGAIVAADSEERLDRELQIPAIASSASRSEPYPPTSCLSADQDVVAEQGVSRAAALPSAVQ